MSATYRLYPDDPSSSVYQHYYMKNTRQTLEFNRQKREEYQKRERFPMTMKEALSQLDSFVDPSDPDTSESNLIHAYQTSERIRKDRPDDEAVDNLDRSPSEADQDFNPEAELKAQPSGAEWLQVVGLIHDVGKILYTSRFNGGEPDWTVVGDTFPVGCAFSDRCVYSQFFLENPDYNKYDEIGIYSPSCGLNSLVMTFGHDEYLYSVLTEYPGNKLPPVALQIIRYHSFYPLHRKGAYTQFLTESDYKVVTELKRFSSYDLYSKHDEFVVTPETIAYYDRLLEKYFPTPLLW